MKKTKYFSEIVLKKRPYIKEEWCTKAVLTPDFIEIQEDGRIKHWLYVEELGKSIRVVTLEDGETIHNAFPDRNYDNKK